MFNTREAFALRRCENNFQQILVCLASLAVEASTNKPLDQRINTFRLQATNGNVINPELGPRDISTYYSEATPLDKQEKQAGLEFKNVVLNYPAGTLVVWVSPPGGELNYAEGRIVVGINKTGHMEAYGVCTTFTAQECLHIGRKLAEPEQDVLQDPEQLRSTVFILPHLPQGQWNFLKKHIPLDEVWDNIASGEAQKNGVKALDDAKRAVGLMWPLLRNMKGLGEQVVMGSCLEKLMMGLGHGIVGGGCGILNSEMLGQPVTVVVESGKFVKNCGQCGKHIGRLIDRGYRCECGGIYAGC